MRVHTDAKAGVSANAVNAAAYTVGSHVVFAEGNYAPSSADGVKLLAHELTHVVQQRGATFGRSDSIPIDSSTSSQEHAAERAANSVTPMSQAPKVAAGGTAALQRKPNDGSVHKSQVAGAVNLSLLEGIPYEKWAETIEYQYRLRGDTLRANAVRACRQEGPAACSKILTVAETQRLYAIAMNSGGDESVMQAQLAGAAAPLLAPRLAPVPKPAPPPLRLVPPPVAPNPAPGAGIGVGVGTAVGVVAFIAVMALAARELWKIGQFQDRLRADGYIILEDPLGLCTGGCHQPNRKSPDITWPDFPPIDAAEWMRPKTTQPASEKQPSPMPQPSPNEQNRQRKCQESTGLDVCGDDRSAEEVARSIASTHLNRSVSEVNCTQIGSEGSFAICGGGPGINLHCEVPGTDYVASLIGCMCCNEDGSIGHTWHPHQSPGDSTGSGRGRRRQDDNKNTRRERGRDRDRKRRERDFEDE